MKSNDRLTPDEVKKMPLGEFEQRFGWRPVSAIEKHYFAGTGNRPDAQTLALLNLGVMGPIDTTGVVME